MHCVCLFRIQVKVRLLKGMATGILQYVKQVTDDDHLNSTGVVLEVDRVVIALKDASKNVPRAMRLLDRIQLQTKSGIPQVNISATVCNKVMVAPKEDDTRITIKLLMVLETLLLADCILTQFKLSSH